MVQFLQFPDSMGETNFFVYAFLDVFNAFISMQKVCNSLNVAIQMQQLYQQMYSRLHSEEVEMQIAFFLHHCTLCITLLQYSALEGLRPYILYWVHD